MVNTKQASDLLCLSGYACSVLTNNYALLVCHYGNYGRFFFRDNFDSYAYYRSTLGAS